MDNTYWLQQTTSKKLFEDIHWSSPLQRNMAGKLVIIGGNVAGFSSVAQAYSRASNSGAGTIRALLPDVLSKTLKAIMPESEFSPTTKSGGFATRSMAQWSDLGNWSDWLIISGDLGRNSETSILLEQFIDKNQYSITLMGDSVDLILASPLLILDKPKLIIALNQMQLQRLLVAIRFPVAAKSTMNLKQAIDLLHSLTLNYQFSVITEHENQILISKNGQVSSSLIKTPTNLNLVATSATVWNMQQPNKPFEAMTAGAYQALYE